jgi:hypothetical protein
METRALQLCKEGESILNIYGSPDKPILRESHLKNFANSDELNAQKDNNLNDILSIFTESIDLAPHLQLPYLLRAKTLTELGNFEFALEDAKSMSVTNSFNLRGSMIEKLVAWRKGEQEKNINLLATVAIVIEKCISIPYAISGMENSTRTPPDSASSNLETLDDIINIGNDDKVNNLFEESLDVSKNDNQNHFEESLDVSKNDNQNHFQGHLTLT